MTIAGIQTIWHGRCIETETPGDIPGRLYVAGVCTNGGGGTSYRRAPGELLPYLLFLLFFPGFLPFPVKKLTASAVRRYSPRTHPS